MGMDGRGRKGLGIWRKMREKEGRT